MNGGLQYNPALEEQTINTFLSSFTQSSASLGADKELKSKTGKESFPLENNRRIYSDADGGGGGVEYNPPIR